MTDAPKLRLPLPGDVNVSDMPHIPLQDSRLMQSRAWVGAKNWRPAEGVRGPGLGFCLWNLWMAAFRAVPAGSLDDCDDMLADAANCDIDFWHAIKDQALRGWERHGGRIWHPVVCELAWKLWMDRVQWRYGKALDSHRAACSRALNKGVEPPDPPGTFLEWAAGELPATCAYLTATGLSVAALSGGRPPDKRENPSDIEPKGREGKVLTPLTPHAGPVDTARVQDGPGSGRAGGEAGKAWYRSELRRLEVEFGAMTPTLKSELQTGKGGPFGFVATLKGCWLQRDGTVPVLVTPSVQRAQAILAKHGAMLRNYFPELTVRHGRVDELRAFKARVGA